MESPERTEAVPHTGTQAGPHGEAPVPGPQFPAGEPACEATSRGLGGLHPGRE